MTRFTDHALEMAPDDLETAARSHLPVLVTGPASLTAGAISAIARRSGRQPRIVACDRASADEIAAALLNGAASGSLVWVQNIDRLDSDGQAAVLNLLDPVRLWTGFRLLTSSTVDLFSRVQAGTFDDVLFYRLNAIHIMVGH